LAIDIYLSFRFQVFLQLANSIGVLATILVGFPPFIGLVGGFSSNYDASLFIYGSYSGLGSSL
jgi:hypothetical protein